MKTVFIFLVGIFFTVQSFGKCASSGLWAFPENGLLKQNSWIVMEGYATSQKIINSLNQDYPIYLLGNGHKVKLNIKCINKGSVLLTQAILMPDEKLISGRIYHLKIDNLNENENLLLTKWNSQTNKEEPISWKVVGGTDTEKPAFLSQPNLVDKEFTYFGCGPAMYVNFHFQTIDESEIWVKTEVIEVESGRKMYYVLSLSGQDTLQVGHGMCSGAFSFLENASYKIRFSLMDTCGNETNVWTDWIKFDSPFEE